MRDIEKEKEIMNEIKKQGEIKDYGFKNYKYWNNVPYIKLLNDKDVFLIYEKMGNITSIFDFEDYNKTKTAIKKIINNSEIIYKFNLNTYEKVIDEIKYRIHQIENNYE